MVLALVIIGAIAFGWFAGTLIMAGMRGISFHQAFLLLPLAFYHRISDRSGTNVRVDPPTIYAILHQSKLDPALMLSLLPSDTLHILDAQSARSFWLEPWREMARTIPFNPEHVFVSRRLVRHLRGKGRLAVYFPDGIEPDTKAFRIYRAVARIALRSEARVVPISVQGSRSRGLFGKLRVSALEPMAIPQMVSASAREQASMTIALFDRVMEADAAV